MSKKLTPQLRFKGFTDEWKYKIFQDVYSWLKNNTLSRDCLNYRNGRAKNIHYGDVLIKYGSVVNISESNIPFVNDNIELELSNSYLLNDGDVIFADTAEDEAVGKSTEINNINNHKVLSGLHTIAVRPKLTFAPFYLGYFHNSASYHHQLLPLMQGVKVLSVNKTAIADTLLSFPSSLAEQRKIGEYFKQIDELISEAEREIERLEKMKLASFQKMFPRPGATTPEIRFAGFTGEWVIGPLSDLLEIDDIRNTNNEYGREYVLSVSGEYGLVNQIEFQGRSFAGASLTGYKITDINHVVYTKSPLKAQPFGIIKSNQYGLGLLSPLYAVYKPKNYASADFIHYYFAPIARLNNYLRPLINKGAKNTLLISDEGALQGQIIYPQSVKEQQAIGEYFRNLDSLLSAKRQKLSKLRNIKKACLDKMFVNTIER